MKRFAPLLAAATIVLFIARSAHAVGAILLTPRDTVKVVDVRYALAVSAAKTTRWASLRVERFPGAMVWVLPVRAGAEVEEVGDAWLDALEIATAPRILRAPCSDGGSMPPSVVIESRPPLGPSARSLRRAVLDDVPALRAFAQSWGFDVPPEMEARFLEVAARGFALLALVYGGPEDAAATRTVRIVDDAFPWVPLFLTEGRDDPVPVTAFVVADMRTRLGAGPEIDLDGARLVLNKDGTTNYGALLRASLLAARGLSWAPEAAGHDVLFEGARGPGDVDPSPALAPSYFRLAAGDDHTDASDLGIALSGNGANAVWITRMSGVVPAHTFGDDLAVTRRDDQRRSPFIMASGGPPSCPAADGGRVGPGGGPGDPPEPPPSSPPWPPPPPGPTTTTPPDLPPVRSVETSCSCAPGPGPTEPSSTADSCDGSDPADTNDSGGACDGSADDSSGDSCNGSGDSSQGSSDDGCDGSSSSGSGSNDGSCSSSGRRSQRSRPRTSVITLALAAVALAVRRRRRGQRRASTGANIGFGQ